MLLEAHENSTFASTCLGFAAYLRGGAFNLNEDRQMMAMKFENAAAVVSAMASALRAAQEQLNFPVSPSEVGRALRAVDSALRIAGEQVS